MKGFFDLYRIDSILAIWRDCMTRLRIEYYGAYYHIIQRGVNKEHIFKEDRDKSYLLEIVAETKEMFDFKIFSYVIMGNHYHFFIQMLNTPISKIMHQINTRYAMYYNKRHKRSGHVFQNRYKGILVQNDSYFVTLIKYIHNNPVAAGICNSMEEYKWSSDIFYRINMDNMVDVDELLNMLSPNRLKAIEKYIELMEDKNFDEKAMMELYENSDIIGTEEFIKKVTKEKVSRLSLDEVLQKACPTDKEFELIKSGSRLRYLTKYKRDYINLSREEGYTYEEIGENIGMTTQGIRNIHMQK